MDAPDFFSREEGDLVAWFNHRRIPHHERVDFYRLFFTEQQLWKSVKRDVKLPNDKKREEIIRFLIDSEVIIGAVLAGQRMGKDALVCDLLQEVKNRLGRRIRIVTLGNPSAPFITAPGVGFVEPGDAYFNLLDVPGGTRECPVLIYTSELDLFFPARDFNSQSNKALNAQLNTLAQNHQKILGCAKLAANVDVSFWRACNFKLFKYITEDNLQFERGGNSYSFLTPAGLLIRPKDPHDKRTVLAVFQDKYLTITHDPPAWYSRAFSEQFNSVNFTDEHALSFARGIRLLNDDKKVYGQMSIEIATRYRFNRSPEWYRERLEGTANL